MFRFDQSTRRDMVIRDIKGLYLQTLPAFEQPGFVLVRDNCDLETIARKNGLNPLDVAGPLNQTAFGCKADTQNHASY
jgi:hypothetical protein